MRQRHKKMNPELRRAQYEAVDENMKLIFNLRDLSHIMRQIYEGKGSPQRILILLKDKGAMTQHTLTELLGIQPGSVSEVLARMEKSGLILRTPSLSDKRTSEICLTEAGETQAIEAAAQRERRHREIFSCLTPEEKTSLLALLEKLYDNWNNRYVHEKRDEI